MNVLLISQCTKNALTETRRILDQFAERRGDRTWQTPITQAGLDTLRRLLRKTARKNTAVACHWIRGKDHSELLWIVGDARQFNGQGATPTNSTRRNVLRAESENDWHTGEDIRLLAQLAALLHDLGKAGIAFQNRLRGRLVERNLYRHEWVSLRLFLAFVGEGDDEDWLQRLANPEDCDEQVWLAAGRYQRDGLDATTPYPFRNLPPLAAAVAWLVVTHHRLPLVPVDKGDGSQDWLGKRAGRFSLDWLETPLAQVAHDWNEIRQPAEPPRIAPYWQSAGPLPVAEPKWRAQAARLARRLLELRRRRDGDWLGNPYVMHLARLSLMLADHHYSSLGLDKEDRPAQARKPFLQEGQTVFANTTKNRRGQTVTNQSLLEHLLGVEHTAGLIAHALPAFERHLPRLAHHRGLRKRSADPRFAWQDKAADAATALREAAREHGAFIVNMASTGCGKTLANARILYALADSRQGLRATYALGLRTLTLQTGRSYRTDLHLGEDELAIRVGGSASRALFEYYEQEAEAHGSASVQELIEEDSHVLYEGVVADHPLLSRAMHDADIRKLLSAPMLVCTVDHMVPATEALRAGRQIAPMLRLMSADLVLDELDDYDLEDLPALTRLVHWAGMLGTRVVLSSATLPPALVEGMFMAYRAGRVQYRRNRGIGGGQAAEQVEIPCLWTDEFGAQAATCADAPAFAAQHAQFVGKRAAKLEKAEPLRRAELVPLDIAKGLAKEQLRAAFARYVRDACLRLHGDHAETDPVSGKRASFGIVRMANIDPLFDVARELFALGAPEDVRIHLCVYHARFPLVQRSAIEHQLDSAFNRRGDGQGVYRLPSIRAALDAHPERNHLFVVLASPVCEVGRDWDADWAVAEPSSMRSLIQLAGRVQRHRRKPPARANVLVFDTNLKALEAGDGQRPAFVRPGFEDEDRFLLASHRLRAIWPESGERCIDARPRIQPRPAGEMDPRHNWIDLEQVRLHVAMLPQTESASTPSRRRGSSTPRLERDQAAPSWQHRQALLTGMLPQQQPFRADDRPDATLVFLPDEEEEHLLPHRIEDDPHHRGKPLYISAPEMLHPVELQPASGIVPWDAFDLARLRAGLGDLAEAEDIPLDMAARKFTVVEVPRSEHGQGWRWHPWLGFSPAR
ncbi:type I-F CRISPR-associated helicase Cas3f [Pseudothauera rhizosphaerae]|uniref:Type I-F CRISPR-associated helicase Cas3 n=1 Tax=Pseudothauera rhizosphaerae TaxID=2565932 RepID=A0A4S4AJ65_9RHOO|nr:type I-F CRISPR-associated helicase Cas3f [Pseudothauera rhizosphaerae]THF59406.1 type I-F CRISPR-associated helicase Cas3 [Pseudothauera rhizosphaerae]